MALKGMEKRGLAATAAVATWAVVCAIAGPGQAAEPGALREMFQDRPYAAPPIAHYQAESGSTFVIDHSIGRSVFMKFDDNPEVWSLRPTPGPRGDIIYKNDIGEPMLRATRLGGLTLFTHDQPQGLAVARAGLAPALRLGVVPGPGALLQLFAQASAKTSRAAQRLIPFDADRVTPGSESLFADAAALTADAFTDVASQDGGRALIGRYSRVTVAAGAGAGASVAGQVVQITVAPDQGFAGRPSSRRIAAAISHR
jgi:hypothetical protein